MTGHAKFAPSAAHRWMRCTGSVEAEGVSDDHPSRYAAEGTVAHHVGTVWLKGGLLAAEALLGNTIVQDGFEIEVTAEMLDFVREFVVLVTKYGDGGTILIDKRVDFSPYVGVPDQKGTLDAGVIGPNRLVVIDLKYGMGVKVDAEDNEQMQLYALGMISDFGSIIDFSDIEEVVLVIHQPRLHHISEYKMSVNALLAFGQKAKEKAAEALDPALRRLVPGEKQCMFCKAKATCPALRNEVSNAMVKVASAADFADLSQAHPEDLGTAMAKVNMVEDWCKAIRSETEIRLLKGQSVPGYKLVEGRRGNRAWADEKKAEELLKSLRYTRDEMYTQKVISPTTCEKLMKPSPKHWAKVEDLITRADGKPSVAPISDKRPALVVSNADSFRDLAELVSSNNNEE